MNTTLIAWQQVKLLSKSPAVLALFVIAPLFLIFIFGQAFTALFAATGAPVGAMDYFGSTLLTLAVFQGTSIASWGIFKEKRSNTEPRLALAPIGRLSIILGAFLGSWAALFAVSSLVMLLARFLLSVNYGPSLIPAFLLLAAESLLAAALGTSLAILTGKEQAANGLVNMIVPALVVLGGGYFIIPDSGFLHTASYVSPIRWLNLAMLRAASPGANEYLAPALLACALPALLLLSAAALFARRPR